DNGSSLSVDLHRNLDLIIFHSFLISFRPLCVEYRIFMAVFLPQFFCHMRSKWSQELDKGFHRLFIDSSSLLCHINKLIVVLHETGDNCVQAEAFQTLGNIVNQFVTDLHHFFCLSYISVFAVHSQLPETVQETVNAVDSSIIPFCIQFRRTYEKFVKSQRVTAVVSYQIIWRNHIAF